MGTYKSELQAKISTHIDYLGERGVNKEKLLSETSTGRQLPAIFDKISENSGRLARLFKSKASPEDLYSECEQNFSTLVKKMEQAKKDFKKAFVEAGLRATSL